jgi:Zn-finger nucleic acid-binding protein
MEIDDFNIILLELKYCERCGGLWLRRQGSDEILCASCAARTTELPGVFGEDHLRHVLRTTIRANGESREVLVMCGEGGHA